MEMTGAIPGDVSDGLVSGTALFVGCNESESARDRQLMRGLKSVGYTPAPLTVPGIKRGRGFLRLLVILTWPIMFLMLMKPRGDVRVIILAHDNHMFIPPARLASAIRRVPLLTDAFDPLTVMTKYDWGGGWKLWFLKRMEKITYRWSAGTFAVTSLQARQITLFYNPGKPVFVVPGSSADPGTWNDDGYTVRAEDPDGPLVVFWGRFHPSHGTDVIMEAARLLRDEDINFELFGKGVRWQDAVDFAAKESLSRVTIHGMAPASELRAAAARAHVALGVFSSLPTVMTTIPWKLGEALSQGLPLITARIPAAEMYLEHGESVYFVPPNSSEALAKAIVTVVSDSALRKRLSVGARTVYDREFADKRIGASLREAIESAS